MPLSTLLWFFLSPLVILLVAALTGPGEDDS